MEGTPKHWYRTTELQGLTTHNTTRPDLDDSGTDEIIHKNSQII
jgi:hypothetical protein